MDDGLSYSTAGAPGDDPVTGAVGPGLRDTYHCVFADAGLDAELADALYAVASDPVFNPFAVDAAPVLRAIARHGHRVAVVSDIHFAP